MSLFTALVSAGVGTQVLELGVNMYRQRQAREQMIHEIIQTVVSATLTHLQQRQQANAYYGGGYTQQPVVYSNQYPAAAHPQVVYYVQPPTQAYYPQYAPTPHTPAPAPPQQPHVPSDASGAAPARRIGFRTT